ncbi:hypothetical protein ACYOEI_32080 [Singulisphaera rosea]
MRRFILDTGIAGLYLDHKRGVFERAVAEVAAGNRVGVAPDRREHVHRHRKSLLECSSED